MATHFSILAWRIPRSEDPGRLQSMWSQRVGCDLAHTPVILLIHFLVDFITQIGTKSYRQKQ